MDGLLHQIAMVLMLVKELILKRLRIKIMERYITKTQIIVYHYRGLKSRPMLRFRSQTGMIQFQYRAVPI